MCRVSQPISTFSQLCPRPSGRRKLAADLASDTLTRVRRGIYARRGTCTPVHDAAAHGGALACVSAARHHGLWVLSGADSLHVDVGAHGHTYQHPGCRCIVHWSEASRSQFAIPSVVVTLRQILACRGVEEFFVAVESALHLGLLTGKDASRLRRETTEEGRRALAYARCDSESGLESLVRWRLRGRGLTIRTQQRIVSVGRVDILIGDRLLIEADGEENHDDPSHRHKDLMRDANAAAWGLVTLRFDYAMIVHDWETVEAAILGAVDHGLHLAPARAGL